MSKEYIIISKTDIEKRIEELRDVEKELINLNMPHSVTAGKIDELISILFKSTPLIPEIEKAFDIGSLKTEQCYNKTNGFISGVIHTDKQDYISNLKLDI